MIRIIAINRKGIFLFMSSSPLLCKIWESVASDIYAKLSQESIIDDLVKSLKIRFSVIPAEAGIQCFPMVINDLDSGFHRSDDFLRIHHNLILLKLGGEVNRVNLVF